MRCFVVCLLLLLLLCVDPRKKKRKRKDADGVLLLLFCDASCFFVFCHILNHFFLLVLYSYRICPFHLFFFTLRLSTRQILPMIRTNVSMAITFTQKKIFQTVEKNASNGRRESEGSLITKLHFLHEENRYCDQRKDAICWDNTYPTVQTFQTLCVSAPQ